MSKLLRNQVISLIERQTNEVEHKLLICHFRLAHSASRYVGTDITPSSLFPSFCLLLREDAILDLRLGWRSQLMPLLVARMRPAFRNSVIPLSLLDGLSLLLMLKFTLSIRSFARKS